MGEIKRFADATKPPVVIPIILVAIDIHIALVVVPLVESGQYYAKHRPCHCPLSPTITLKLSEMYSYSSVLRQVSLIFY